MTKEIWKPVVGYEELFLVSNLGQVKSVRYSKERILKQTISKNGYYTIATKIGGRVGKNVCFKVHRLVAEAFLSEPDQHILEYAIKSFYGKVLVNHIDGNKLNNRVDNLEWCTNKENYEHARTLGLNKPRAQTTRKLTTEDAEYIRKNYIPRNKQFGSRALAKKFNVNKNRILDIVNMKTYVLSLE